VRGKRKMTKTFDFFLFVLDCFYPSLFFSFLYDYAILEDNEINGGIVVSLLMKILENWKINEDNDGAEECMS
jgi:hypothetical protein